MNQAESTLPGPAPNWLGDHRGPLTVTDNFAVLDDPVEQETFTQRIEQADGDLAESVLMVQGMTCAACADTVESALELAFNGSFAVAVLLSQRLIGRKQWVSDAEPS